MLTKEDLDQPDAAMKRLLDWELLDYVDAMRVDPNLRCDCGRALRYRYTVLHKETGQIHHLGKVHFELHTNLESGIVIDIMRGFKQIDLERDEILIKMLRGWKLPYRIPPQVELPNALKDQLEVGLPLLERQMVQLYELSKPYLAPRIPNPVLTRKLIREVELVENEEPLPADFQPEMLLQKLNGAMINESEARQLYDFIRRTKKTNIADTARIQLAELKKAAAKALGRIQNREIRRWLVEIEEL